MITVDVVGGGVAGLALAAGLDPHRFRVRLHERGAPAALATIYGMWPHAMRALLALGLDDGVRELGLPAPGAKVLSRSGRVLSTTPGPTDAWLVPRPVLLEMLESRVPGTVERVPGQVADPHALDGDLVVGADGVHSVVRTSVWGRASRSTGAMALRGVVDGEVTEHNPGQRGLHEWWGGGMIFGLTPDLWGTTNWYAAMPEFSTTPQDGLAWAREAYAGFPAPVRRVLAAADPARTLVNRIVEAPSLVSLVRGRYVLVGDAAHAMSPNLGRGACESLVDAVTLARELSTRPVAEALRRYQRQRLLPGQGVRLASAAVRRLSMGWPG